MTGTGWLIECSRCGATYAVDRAAIMGGTWQTCPACSADTPKPAVGPSAASGGQIRSIPGHEGDSTYTAESTRTGDSGKPEALTGRGWLIECPECHRSCLVTREEIMSGSWLRTPCPHCTGGDGKEAT